MMEVFLIYRQIHNELGQLEKIELVECDLSEAQAEKFKRLYTLQIPKDLKSRVFYKYAIVEVS